MLTVGVRQGRAFASVGGATGYWFCPGCVLAALVVVLNAAATSVMLLMMIMMMMMMMMALGDKKRRDNYDNDDNDDDSDNAELSRSARLESFAGPKEFPPTALHSAAKGLHFCLRTMTIFSFPHNIAYTHTHLHPHIYMNIRTQTHTHMSTVHFRPLLIGPRMNGLRFCNCFGGSSSSTFSSRR